MALPPLQSHAITANSSGWLYSEKRYMPWGEERWASGTIPTTFHFTGQREQAELGLYFYNARWYDPSLGRFLSADSIVPNPYDSQAWDRYAYGANNPIRYIDPTGHRTCTDEQAATGDETCDQNIFADIPTNDVTPWEDIPLTPGGAEVLELFEKMQRIAGWWNEDGDFTLDDFIGLWILHEAAGDEEIANILSLIVSQNLYVGGYNSAYCSSDGCRNGALNFIGAYSQRSGGLFNGTKNLSSYSGPMDGNSMTMEYAAKFGYNALHPTKLIWSRNSGPSNWGNSTPWGFGLRKNNIPERWLNGISPNTVYYYWDNFVVFSIMQRKHWSSAMHVDTSMDKLP